MKWYSRLGVGAATIALLPVQVAGIVFLLFAFAFFFYLLANVLAVVGSIAQILFGVLVVPAALGWLAHGLYACRKRGSKEYAQEIAYRLLLVGFSGFMAFLILTSD